ncbi:hypothetical protein [Streptomyces sp. NPDC046984]|uniref:hypothetical protein n=1 Tax=unclassified Streptomyces TaxID=2593676 RepID=UPI0033CD2658
MMAKLPYASSCSTPTEARQDWEAIKIGRFYGLQALGRLRAHGTVAIDPTLPGVYFFVLAGTTSSWPVAPTCMALTVTKEFEVPAAGRRTPPGTYWLVPPRRGTITLTDDAALLAALIDVIPDWAEAS